MSDPDEEEGSPEEDGSDEVALQGMDRAELGNLRAKLAELEKGIATSESKLARLQRHEAAKSRMPAG